MVIKNLAYLLPFGMGLGGGHGQLLTLDRGHQRLRRLWGGPPRPAGHRLLGSRRGHQDGPGDAGVGSRQPSLGRHAPGHPPGGPPRPRRRREWRQGTQDVPLFVNIVVFHLDDLIHKFFPLDKNFNHLVPAIGHPLVDGRTNVDVVDLYKFFPFN